MRDAPSSSWRLRYLHMSADSGKIPRAGWQVSTTSAAATTTVWTAAHGPAEVAVMAVSGGFFVQDFLYIVLKEFDFTFFMHHFAVLMFLIASRLSGSAGKICTVGLALGEVSPAAHCCMHCRDE